MAIILTSQIIEQGDQNAALKITNETTSSANETLALKVDATSSGPLGVMTRGAMFYPYNNISLHLIRYNIQGMTVRLLWDADVPSDLLILNGYGKHDFDYFGGLKPPRSLAGATGSILLSTIGAAAGSSYSIEMEFQKNIDEVVPQPGFGYILAQDGTPILTEGGLPIQTE